MIILRRTEKERRRQSKGFKTMDTMERLKKLLAEVYDGEIETETITEETRVAEDIGMKSIAMLYMAMAVEGEFGVSLTNEDLPKMRTVGDIIRLIEERQA